MQHEWRVANTAFGCPKKSTAVFLKKSGAGILKEKKMWCDLTGDRKLAACRSSQLSVFMFFFFYDKSQKQMVGCFPEAVHTSLSLASA